MAAKKKLFAVTISVEIEVDPDLIKSVLTDEWRSMFYRDICTPADVAAHLAFNMVQGSRLITLDGFADQDPERVTIGRPEVVDSEEVIPGPPARPQRRRSGRKAR